MIYPRSFIDTIKAKVNIITLAELYGITVMKNGNVYQANCIHPGDNTPSLTFFLETNSFYCFGCGAGGDVVQFVAWINDISFPKAVEMLSEYTGIYMEDINTDKIDPRVDLIKKATELNRLYWKTLQNDKNTLEYLMSRSINEVDINHWRLGLVPDTHSKPYSKRLVFAIMDEESKTIGFGYRSLDKTMPKYINSSDSIIFKKSHVLYGLNYAKKLIKQKGYVILVEGYTDVIQLQKYGEPAVGLMGTNISIEHVKTLSKYTKNVILSLDGDAPGQIAMKKAATLFSNEGFIVKAILLTKDPDEVTIELGHNIHNFIMREALLMPSYEINTHIAIAQSKIDAIILSSIENLIPILMQIRNPVELEHFIIRIANTFKLSKEDIYMMIAKGGSHGQNN